MVFALKGGKSLFKYNYTVIVGVTERNSARGPHSLAFAD